MSDCLAARASRCCQVSRSPRSLGPGGDFGGGSGAPVLFQTLVVFDPRSTRRRQQLYDVRTASRLENSPRETSSAAVPSAISSPVWLFYRVVVHQALLSSSFFITIYNLVYYIIVICTIFVPNCVFQNVFCAAVLFTDLVILALYSITSNHSPLHPMELKGL